MKSSNDERKPRVDYGRIPILRMSDMLTLLNGRVIFGKVPSFSVVNLA